MGLSALHPTAGARHPLGMTGPEVLTLLGSIAFTASVLVFITVANWPRETPRRPLGDTRELSPFDRL